MQIAKWHTSLAVGSTAQLAVAECPNEQTLDPQSVAPSTPQPAALCPSPRNVL